MRKKAGYLLFILLLVLGLQVSAGYEKISIKQVKTMKAGVMTSLKTSNVMKITLKKRSEISFTLDQEGTMKRLWFMIYNEKGKWYNRKAYIDVKKIYETQHIDENGFYSEMLEPGTYYVKPFMSYNGKNGYSGSGNLSYRIRLNVKAYTENPTVPVVLSYQDEDVFENTRQCAVLRRQFLIPSQNETAVTYKITMKKKCKIGAQAYRPFEDPEAKATFALYDASKKAVQTKRLIRSKGYYSVVSVDTCKPGTYYLKVTLKRVQPPVIVKKIAEGWNITIGHPDCVEWSFY